MINLAKEITTKKIPLSKVLNNDTYKGDIVFNIGGFAVSSVNSPMYDASTMIKDESNVSYDEYMVISRPFPWLRLLLPDIEKLPYKNDNNIDYCELPIEENIKIVVFKCSVFADAPYKSLKKKKKKYIKENNIESKNSFILVNSQQDRPWCLILLTNVDNLPKLIGQGE